jgi:hypothetical protein
MEGFLLAGGFANCLLNKLSEGFTPLLPEAGGIKSALVAQSRLHFCDFRPPLAPLQLLIPPSLLSCTEPFYVIFYCPEDVSSRCLRNVCKFRSDCTGSHPRRHSSVSNYALKSDTFSRMAQVDYRRTYVRRSCLYCTHIEKPAPSLVS